MTDSYLTVEEAARVLGVEADAASDAVQAAFRRAIGAAHPDRGGADERARLVVAAREVLLTRSKTAPPQAARQPARRARTFVRHRRFAWR